MVSERNRLGDELARLGLAREQEREGTAEKAREIVLVAGVDFPKYDEDGPTKDSRLKCKDGSWKLDTAKPTGSAWRQRCLNVAEARLIKEPSLRVTLFDFEKGTRSLVTLDKKKKPAVAVEESFGALSPADYRRVHSDGGPRELVPLGSVCADRHPARPYVRLCPGVSGLGAGAVDEPTWLALANGASANTKPDTHQHGWSKHGLSIVHAYAYVESIGRSRPGTLAELHLFGHASSAHYPGSGTAFVNTDDPLQGSGGKRHPLDLDARANVDFLPATMDVAAFARAFSSEAMSFVWGCNWFRPIYYLLRTLSAQLTKDKALEAHAALKFEWRDSGSQDSEDNFRRFFEVDPVAWCRQRHTARPSGKWVRDKLQKLLDESYMQRLADASGHAVTGGLPGTYSDYDDDPKIALSKRLSHIPMGKRFRKPPGIDPKTKRPGTLTDLRPVLRVFKRHFAVTFNQQEKGLDPDFGRGFGIYRPKQP